MNKNRMPLSRACARMRANLIVVENARRENVHISFWEYCKVGVPLTVLTMILGIGWLEFVGY
ncbi:MAG: hypothetical protein ACLQNE_24550 [Thermoguttaceae bacterium]